MTNQYDTATIHSYYINLDRSLTPRAKQRVDLGIELFKKGDALTLTMLGGCDTPNVQCAHSEAMKEYAIGCGVKEELIYSENSSIDTIGEALFAKLEVILPKGLNKIIAVSEDFHIPRIKAIYEFIYGNKFNIRYEGVKTNQSDEIKTDISNEVRKLSAFHNLFRGVTPGNDVEILERLFKEHSLYREQVDLQKRILKLLK